ncbi:MAG TPA: hypothetical protein VKA54_14320 [Gemmatimonadaceae bacterium]|nr:hypothetical protein [Gemmatimonadaceae bacterium]
MAELLAVVLAELFFMADLDAPLADDFARVEAPRFAAVGEPALAPRFAVVFARVAFLPGVLRVAPERAPARFAAMPSVLAKSMPEQPPQPLVAPST